MRHILTYKRANAVFGILGILVAACTSSVSGTVELPYEEKIVVRAILQAGQPLNNIQISRTLPPLDEFTYEKVFVSDAEATVTVDGRAYALTLQPALTTTTASAAPLRSLYEASAVELPSAKSGKTYTLTVRWNGLTATATTRVPALPEVDSAFVRAAIVPPRAGNATARDTVFTTSVALKVHLGDVYRIGTVLRTPQPSAEDVSVRGFGDAVQVTQSMPTTFVSNTWQYTRATVAVLTGQLQTRAILEVYDGDFYAYYRTRSRGGQISAFSPGGPNVEWNVRGDGLGMFIGKAERRVDAAVVQ